MEIILTGATHEYIAARASMARMVGAIQQAARAPALPRTDLMRLAHEIQREQSASQGRAR